MRNSSCAIPFLQVLTPLWNLSAFVYSPVLQVRFLVYCLFFLIFFIFLFFVQRLIAAVCRWISLVGAYLGILQVELLIVTYSPGFNIQ